MSIPMRSLNLFARHAGALAPLKSTSSSPQVPYICANCRATRTHLSQQQRQQPQRPSRRQQHTSSSPPRNTAPRPIQTHYDLFPRTFPSGPPPAAPFTPNLQQLRQEYLQLQSRAHPDLAPADRKPHFEALSSRINEAYKTLQDPLRRAQYLLAQNGIDVEDESAKLSEQGLLVEVMEAREAIDEAESEDEVGELKRENDARMEKSVRALDEAFASGDWDGAATEAIRLRYWVNIAESISGWEPGSGGGILHH